MEWLIVFGNFLLPCLIC